MNKQITDFFESHGFKHDQTGGGCTAFVRDNTTGGGEPDGEQTIVTNGDLEAPCDMGDSVRVSRCTLGGEELSFNEFATVFELMVAVKENPAGYIL